MPYQRKNSEGTRTISPVVDAVLYEAVRDRGFKINELINLIFAIVLEVDDEMALRYETLLEARKRLMKDVRPLIQQSKERVLQQTENELRREQHNIVKSQVLALVCDNKPNDVDSDLIFRAVYDQRESSKREVYERRMVSLIANNFPGFSEEAALEIIRHAVLNKWELT